MQFIEFYSIYTKLSINSRFKQESFVFLICHKLYGNTLKFIQHFTSKFFYKQLCVRFNSSFRT